MSLRTAPLLVGIMAFGFGCGGDDDSNNEDGLSCGTGTHEEDGQCVPDDGDDGVGVVDAPGVPASAKRVFVTRTTYRGDIGGLTGADAACAAAASGTGHSGTWKAWLSDFDTSAIDRITAAGPWYDFADDMVFANKAALMSAPLVPMEVQETGERLVITDRVWTATRAGGQRDGAGASDYCGEWLSQSGNATAGNTGATDGGWTDQETVPCTNMARLYCFEN